MSKTIASITIGIFGSRGAQAKERHGCGLWDAGYTSCVAAEGAEPVFLGETLNGPSIPIGLPLASISNALRVRCRRRLMSRSSWCVKWR